MSLFGSSGIRGPYPHVVHEGLFLRLGTALGGLFPRLVVGRDVRRTGPGLSHALAAGAASAGATVADAGVVPTPTVAHLAARFDAGAMVTASHNPPGDNGLKLWSPRGMAFDADLRGRVETALEADPEPVAWDRVGAPWPYEGALEEHREKILAALEPTEGDVALDCGNGATCVLSPFLLRDLGCRVTTLHAQPDGTFPGRGPEPSDEALVALGHLVRTAGCDVGLAHDGDGDRMVALDEGGRPVRPERLLVVFARSLGARKVVTPVDASMVVEDLLGRDAVVRCRVGDVHVAESLVAQEADLGGEPSGTWIFPDFALCPDGPYAAALLCTLLEEAPLGELAADVPDYPLLRASLPYDPARGPGDLEGVLAAVDADRVDRLDGWRLDFGDAWALVRPSGTEPKVRMTVEARTEARAREIYASLHETVSRLIP